MKIFNFIKNYPMPFVFLFIFVIFLIVARTVVDGWVGLGYTILALLSLIVAVLFTIFEFVKVKTKLSFKWYWYILIVPAMIFGSVLIIRLIAGN